MEKEIEVFFGKTYLGSHRLLVKPTCGSSGMTYVVMEGNSYTVATRTDCNGGTHEFIQLKEK